MIASLCKKEIRRIRLPDVIISVIVSFCSWKIPRIHMWYIVASKLDSTRLDSAKQLDMLNTFLSEDDMEFKSEVMNESIDYVRHIKMNNTI